MLSLLSELSDSGLRLAGYIVERDFKDAMKIHGKDDLVGYAIIGIVEASIKFDKSKGVAFKTFACYKAKQRIIDFVRQVRNQHIASIEDIPDYEFKIRRRFG